MSSEAGGGLYYPDSADEEAPDPSAILAGIKQRAEEAALYSLAEMATLKDVSAGGCISASALDAPPLLAAVEAVLKLAGEWEQDAAYLNARAGRVLDSGKLSGPATSAMLSGRAQAKKDNADELVTAITCALTGKEGSEDE